MKADSYVKHGDVKALVCTVNKEKEKEKGPPCHYGRPTHLRMLIPGRGGGWMRPPSGPWLLAAVQRTEAGGALVYGLWWLGDGDGGVATLASCSLNTHSPPYQPRGNQGRGVIS